MANTYAAGAPECYRPDETSVRDKLRVGQNVDIWSLGCVYSEAARWIKNHYKGVVLYRNERREEISKIPGFQDADCFHDGNRILTAVRESHKKSTTNLRTEDYITKTVVDRMIADMLDVAPARPTAANLWYKSKGIVSEARQQLQLANTFPSGERRASRSTLSRSRTVPEHTPPTPPNPPPGISPPDSPGFERSYQRGSRTQYRPKRISTHSRTDSNHALESPSLIEREEQQGQSPGSISEDRLWTAHSPASGSRVASSSRFAGQGDPFGIETTKRSSQNSAYVGSQLGSSGMVTSREHDTMAMMNGGSLRGTRNRYSNNSEGSFSSPILGKAGTNRRSSSPDEMDHTGFMSRGHSRHISRGEESSHSRVASDNSTLATMVSAVSYPSNTGTSNYFPQLQHSHPPVPPQHTINNSTPPVTPPERWSVEEALEWKSDRKETGRPKAIPNPQLHDRLRKRNHVG